MPLFPAEYSLAVTVNVDVVGEPTASNGPDITPVELFSEPPAGRAPDVTLNVTAPDSGSTASKVKVSVALFASATVPKLSEAVLK